MTRKRHTFSLLDSGRRDGRMRAGFGDEFSDEHCAEAEQFLPSDLIVLRMTVALWNGDG